jgi:hypothetical protein
VQRQVRGDGIEPSASAAVVSGNNSWHINIEQSEGIVKRFINLSRVNLFTV